MSAVDLKMEEKEPMPMSPIGGPSEDKYPSFRYSGPVDLELPDVGEMVVKFVKREETSSVKQDGKHWYECRVEIRSIVSVDGKEPESHVPPPVKNYAEATNNALDSIRDSLQKRDDDEDEY
jgi:hypothetical protein